MSETLVFKPGETIIREGENGREIYMLGKGTVEVRRHGVKVFQSADKGAFFGEMSGILRRPRTASVIAVTEVEMTRIESDLNGIVERHPRLAQVIMHTLADRLAAASEKLASTDPVRGL